MKYVHTNIVARDWRRLAEFYVRVFDCIPLQLERDLSGEWLAKGTAIVDAALQGIHLRLPGYDANGPTLEIYSYETYQENQKPCANRLGIRHLAFLVDDLSRTLDTLLRCGGSRLGTIVSQHIEGVGALTFVYAADPEGNILELQHWQERHLDRKLDGASADRETPSHHTR